MSQNRPFVLFTLVLVFLLAATAAIGETQKIFSLSRDEDQKGKKEKADMLEPIFIPRIEPGNLEVGISLGQIRLGMTLLSHDQIIFKYTEESTYWGDVELTGQTAFNPVVRVNYNLSSWLAIEEAFSISVSEYSQSVRNTFSRDNNDLNAGIVPNPDYGEFSLENRSVLTMASETNLILYPFNLTDDGTGKWHPYLTGGLSFNHVSLNSQYMDDASRSFGYSGGIGMRLISDDLISVRFDIKYHVVPLDFTPSKYFAELNEGTLLIPTAEFTTGDSEDDDAIHEIILTEYDNDTVSYISYGVGFVATF